ncbi:hypothetical protein EDB83DRAFT_2520213 [Lactarius deliciosus]|nr:hypothetical protein EDB83DRAFT_2520213 [Lactarius deliciosus]
MPNAVNDGDDTTIDFATYLVNNLILALLWEVPSPRHGRLDLLHARSLSTVANWGLGSVGRGDTNKMLSNVYSFGYTNLDVPLADT